MYFNKSFFFKESQNKKNFYSEGENMAVNTRTVNNK